MPYAVRLLPVFGQSIVKYREKDFPACFGLAEVNSVIDHTIQLLVALTRLGVHIKEFDIPGHATRLQAACGCEISRTLHSEMLHPNTLLNLAASMAFFQFLVGESYALVYPEDLRKCLVMSGLRWIGAHFENLDQLVATPGTFFHWIDTQRDYAIGAVIPTSDHDIVHAKFASIPDVDSIELSEAIAATYFFLTGDRVRYAAFTK